MTAIISHYLALGDSISIDLYPAADVARRHPGKASSDRLGAASLLVENDDRLWPEFRGRDLKAQFPKINATDLTADGATTESLLRQVERIPRSDEPTLATITAGGNDLLGEIGWAARSPSAAIAARLQQAIEGVLARRPQSRIIVGTVYDPSDGTNRLPGVPGTLEREAEWLREYNDRVRDLVATSDQLLLADIHRHFLGHGLGAPEAERWYLQESIIEPNARGASEVRRLWLALLE